MGEDSVPAQRTPARRKARQLARHLRGERPDYAYLKEVFRHLRDELGVEVATTAKKLPYVPAEAEIRRYYQTVWTARRSGDIVLIKTQVIELRYLRDFTVRETAEILNMAEGTVGPTTTAALRQLKQIMTEQGGPREEETA